MQLGQEVAVSPTSGLKRATPPQAPQSTARPHGTQTYPQELHTRHTAELRGHIILWCATQLTYQILWFSA